MRSIDDQLMETEKRSESIRLVRARRRTAATAVLASAVCVALISVLSVTLSGMDMAMPAVSGETPFGSLILMNNALPYMIVGILAFLLGISFTMLCIHVRERKKDRK